jgi:hypothetical protein
MKTFTYIAHKLFIRDVKYEHDIDITSNKDTDINDRTTRVSYMKHIFNINTNNLHADLVKCLFLFSDETKYEEIKKNLIDAYFVSDETKTSFLDFICEIQKIYWAFTIFVNRAKLRYYKNKVEHDLLLTPISIKQRNVIRLCENNNMYLFTLNDLSRIIITAICNSPSFHSEPLAPKNPYSGVAFSKCNLYNIYFYMKERLYNVPDAIYKFFLSDFNLKLFEDNNQLIIRDTYINQFVDNEDDDEIIDHIYDMINKCFIKLDIDDDFPNKILIDTLKSAVTHYIHFKYNFDLSKRRPNFKLMVTKVKNILNKCPGFGRKITIIKDRKKYTSFITLNGKTEPVLYVRPDNKPTIIDDSLSDDVSNADISNNLFQEFGEQLTIRLNEMIQDRNIQLNSSYDTDYFNSDDEIEYDESIFDP